MLTSPLKLIRTAFDRGEYQSLFQVTLGGTPLFHESTLKAWLNGMEYHQIRTTERRSKSLRPHFLKKQLEEYLSLSFRNWEELRDIGLQRVLAVVAVAYTSERANNTRTSSDRKQPKRAYVSLKCRSRKLVSVNKIR